MFSGLIREIAHIKDFNNNRLEVFSSYDKARLGDSIAINGACLSIVSFFSNGFAMELSSQTLSSIACENYARGSKVHLEPALSIGDRLDGHIVQGHIDGIGEISKIAHSADSSEFWIETDAGVMDFIVPKGSVCIDGISLTITKKAKTAFGLTIIPHTLKNSLFGEYKLGRRVNIETDIITRSVVSALRQIVSESSHKKPSWAEIDALNLGY